MTPIQRRLLEQHAAQVGVLPSAIAAALARIAWLESLCGDAAVEMGYHSNRETVLLRRLKQEGLGRPTTGVAR